MPLPTPPSKLGNLLSPDEYKARARPAKSTKKLPGDGDAVESESFGSAAPLELVAAAAVQQVVETASGTRRRKQPATAALLQPVASRGGKVSAAEETVSEAPAQAARPTRSTGRELQDNLETKSRNQPPAAPAQAPARPSPTSISAVDTPRQPRRPKATGPVVSKLFVLDTNVLMHDPSSLFRFEEHDVYLPMMTLEELDNHKKGMSEVARNARQVSRTLDGLVANIGDQMMAGIPLSRLGNREAAGRLFFQTQLAHIEPVDGLPQGKADNQILGVVRALQKQFADRQVVLVSKDINMRVKAHALGLPAEDYFNDQVLEDKDLLYPGVLELPQDFWSKHGKGMESWQDTKTGTTYYRVTGPLCGAMLVNQFVFLEPRNGEPPFHAQVREINGKTALLQTLRDYGHHKNNVWGVTARNREQNFALNLLMNPEIDFVTLLGQAGTGKTLLALAAGLAQVLDDKRYNEIIVTRATVPVGEDIGFLPGTEEEKMQPWMGAFDDNLEVLQKTDDSSGEWGRAATQELIKSRLKVKSMSFMRGRTFVDKYLIIDEAQNLTPKQMKTLVTRAGPGTKIICLGNIAQIDTPYLTEGSSGLTYVVDRFKGWRHSGHITLARGERSRLADYASEIL